MSRPRIIFVGTFPPNKRNIERFGFRYLASRNFTVKHADVSRLIDPRNEFVIPREASGVDWIIRSRADLKKFLAELGPNDVVIVADLPPIVFSLNQLLVVAGLLKSESTVGSLSVGSLPLGKHLAGNLGRVNIFTTASVRLRLMSVITGVIAFFSRHVTRRKVRAIFFSLILRLVIHRSYDFIWAGVDLARFSFGLVGRSTRVVYIHNLDYDLVLQYQREEPTSDFDGSPLVWLGKPGPFDPSTNDEFIVATRAALQAFEDKFGKPVIVAAHPHSTPEVSRHLYSGKAMVSGRTTELIAKAGLVVCGASTAVGIVAVFQKPLVLVASREQMQKWGEILRAQSTLLGVPLLRLEDLSWNFEIPVVSPERYMRYVETFVKRPGTAMVPFWEQVADSLAESSSLAGGS